MKRLLAGALLLLVSASAHAYPLYSLGTQLKGTTWRWSYSGRNSSGSAYQHAHATAANVRHAISETFRVFDQGVARDAAARACSRMKFTETTAGGGSSTARVSEVDGQNTEGVFVTSRNDPLYDYMQGGVIAFALPVPDDEGYVADCDTAFNAVEYLFATDGWGDMALQDVAMQETAHCFGLHHVCEQSPGDGQPPCDGPDVDTRSVMYPFAMAGFGGSLPDGRDQDNMCQLYPVNGVGRPCDPLDLSLNTGFAVPDCQLGTSCLCTTVGRICSFACTTDTECPPAARCDSGACVPDFYPGTQHSGVPTRTAFTCGGSGQPHRPVGAQCGSDEECGAGMHCSLVVPFGYCTVDCRNQPCPDGSVCVNDMERARDAYCVTPCTFDEATCETSECGRGQHCQPFSNDGTGVCWAACSSHRDCDPSGRFGIDCDAATGTCYPRSSGPVCGGRDGPDAGGCTRRCAGVACGGDDGCGGTCDGSESCLTEEPDGGSDPTGGGGGGSGPRAGGCGCGAGEASGLGLLALLARRRRSAR